MTTILNRCRPISLIVALLAVTALAGCGLVPVPTTTPTLVRLPTRIPSPTLIPTETLPPIPSITPEATLVTSAVQPTAVSVAPATRTPQASSGTMTVKIFLIAVNDNGKTGKKIGCSDSAVAVNRTIPATSAPLTAALKELFSLRTLYYGESGLYNALYQSNLKIGGISIVNKKATIQLTGTYSLGGVCDNPRFAAQIEETALQFTTVSEVAVTINNTPLEKILSGQ